jgi:hypothetical protein
MNKKVLLSTRVALLSVLLLSGHTVAYGQKAPNRQNPLLPDVHLGLNKLGVDAILTPLAAPKAVLPILPSLSVPGVAIRVAPPIVSVSATVGGGGVGASVTVPPIGGLTPLLGTNVNVQLGDGTPGTPQSQDVYALNLMAAAQSSGQMAERALELIPTCR